MQGKISEKLQQVLHFIQTFSEDNGYPPSVRDICAGLKISSTATVYYYITKLEKEGLLKKSPSKNRSLGVVDPYDSFRKQSVVKVPLIGKISAGEPILAVENIEDVYPLPADIFHGDDLFMLKVRGDSMIEAGIFDNDYIVVKKQDSAQNRDIVVALIEDSATVKRFFKKDDKIILHPENQRLQEIVLDHVEIMGIVVGSLRKLI